MKRGLALSFLFVFGILYSIYLSLYSGFFVGFIFILMTIGFTTTIYMLDKKIDYRIIIYIWVGIVMIAIVGFMIIGIFKLANLFKSPLKFI